MYILSRVAYFEFAPALLRYVSLSLSLSCFLRAILYLLSYVKFMTRQRRLFSRLGSRWNSREECVPRAASRCWLAICVECTSSSARDQVVVEMRERIIPSCSRRHEMMDIFRERRLSRQCFKRVTPENIMLSLSPLFFFLFSFHSVHNFEFPNLCN